MQNNNVYIVISMFKEYNLLIQLYRSNLFDMCSCYVISCWLVIKYKSKR